MTKQEVITPGHKNVFSALAAAQMEMDTAKKNATNPHFKKAYADLSSVYGAALPSLNRHGIALYHTTEFIGDAEYMTTILHHGESETELRCPIRLIVNKNDMQGYKSATTYAKRIGSESVTGLAPEDDDGNDAAKAAPKVVEVQTVSPEQFTKLRDLAEQAGVKESAVCDAYKAPSFQQFPLNMFSEAVKKLHQKIEKATPASPAEELVGENIPY